MLRPKRNDKPVLLNVPDQILDQVDMAVREQGVTRSQFLRQAVERNLRHYQMSSAPSSLASITRAASEAGGLERFQCPLIA